uniref:ribosomal protein S7 n=1 Tax=Meteora sporadica TaxID=2913902 RepID=UPI003003334F|nr:ribosomal protein S7 [Meteora sporadica]WVH37092.1 ribosomal protein S7 [Meteora sporadica]
MKKKWFLSPDKIYSHINKSRSFYLHFVHTLMKDGKKQVSEKLMNDCFLYIKRHTLKNPFKVLKRAVLNNRISVRIQSYRKSGRNILVPVAIKLLRQYSFAIKRIVEVCDERREYDYSQRLAKELMDSYLNKGLAIRKRNDYYRLVNANKINIYFKFGR